MSGLRPARWNRFDLTAVDRAACVSALLLAAAAPPSPLPLLVVIALAPLLVALQRLPPGRAGRRSALRAGALGGAVYWAVMLLWIPQAGLRVGAWVVPGYLAIVTTLAVLGSLAAALYHRLAVDRRLPPGVAAALSFGAVEWTRAAWLGPFSFPWMGLALPLSAHPALIQGAAWVGEIGLAVGVAGANGVSAAALMRAGPARWWRLAALGGALGLVAFGGLARIDGPGREPLLRALVVQPDVSLAAKRSGGETALSTSLEAIEHTITDALATLATPLDVDLVVLPETALPLVLDGPGSESVRVRVAALARRLGAPILVGAYALGPGRGANAVFLASSDPHAVWPSASKVRLVPGVEWAPGSADGIHAGAAPTPLVVERAGGPAVVLGPLICIESAGPEPARALVRAGAQLLVNVTNDAWLAEAPWWTRSAAFAQHPAHLPFRAVEGGVGALRAANNGWSEVVDPYGRRTVLLPAHTAGAAVAEAERLMTPPPFVITGPWIGPVVVVLALILAAAPVPWVHARVAGGRSRSPGRTG